MFKTKEELDKALAEGIITQDEYNVHLAALEKGDDPAQTPSKEDLMRELLESEALKEMMQKQVQSAEDRIRTQYTKEIKEKENLIKALETAKMTEEERTAHELAERERIVAEKEEQIKRMTLESHAAKIVSDPKYKLTNEALQFIHAENETEIENRANALSKFIEAETQKRLEAEFAKHGYNPAGTKQSGSTEKNPWTKGQENYTEQGRIIRENPEKAKQLAAQAGVQL